ncbi:hypothetical protein [Streptomyces sp. t39]|nr:hypothetical protein [Streptomyces sp. t39]
MYDGMPRPFALPIFRPARRALRAAGTAAALSAALLTGRCESGTVPPL